jgi:glycosyltransferase involved in cell wall biosynthesis
VPGPRVAYLTSTDPEDRRAWSGTHWSMLDALRRQGADVVCLGPAPVRPPVTAVARARAERLLLRRTWRWGHSLAAAARFAEILGPRLAASRADIVFAPAASTELAALETQVPVAYASDATFRLMRDAYARFSGLSPASAREGEEIESRAMRRSAHVILPSAWAARSALKDYGVPEANVHVVPFGASLPPPDRVERRPLDDVRLLFLAREWDRKGGDVALDATRRLRRRGIDARLVVCGCAPPADAAGDPAIEVTGSLDKNDPRDVATLQGVLTSSTVAILPTRADAFPIALCEAAAYGLPAVAAGVGGVPEAVVDGETGTILPVGADGGDYADAVDRLVRDRTMYDACSSAARAHYAERLNWDAWGRTVWAVLSEAV